MDWAARASIGPLGETAPPTALPPEVADAADPLRGIEGLDTAAGLRRVLDKRPAYESLLRKFVAGQAGAVQATRAAMAAGQHDEALRAMHTLKGTAGTIGAAPLAKLAAAVEEAIGQKAPATTIDTLLNPVDAACQALVAALRTALPPEDDAGAATAAAAPHAPIDAAAAQQLLAQLDALLADDDSDAIELFKESTPTLKALLGPAYAGVKRALDGYDFVEALAALREHHTSEYTPIIFVTAITDEMARHKGLSLGAIDYVFKPIDPELLKLRVGNLMVYVEHRKQLQKDFDLLRENAQLRSEVQRLRGDLQRLQAPAGG